MSEVWIVWSVDIRALLDLGWKYLNILPFNIDSLRHDVILKKILMHLELISIAYLFFCIIGKEGERFPVLRIYWNIIFILSFFIWIRYNIVDKLRIMKFILFLGIEADRELNLLKTWSMHEPITNSRDLLSVHGLHRIEDKIVMHLRILYCIHPSWWWFSLFSH